MNLVKTGDVLDMWKIDGERLNIRTFNKLIKALVKSGEMKVGYFKDGDRVFDEDDAIRIRKYFPKTRPPRYIGIVNHVIDEIKKRKRH